MAKQREQLVGVSTKRSDAGAVAVGVESPNYPALQPPMPRKTRFLTARTIASTLLLPIVIYPLLFLALILAGTLFFFSLPLWGMLLLIFTGYWSYTVGFLPFADLYLRTMIIFIKLDMFVNATPQKLREMFPLRRLRPGKYELLKDEIDYALNLRVPSYKEEDFIYQSVKAVPTATRMVDFVLTSLHFLPELPFTTRFGANEDPVAFIMKHLGPIYPEIVEEWPDKQSDDALARLCVAGLGAHRLEKEGAFLVVRTNAMAALPVRPGLGRYGGDCYLDAKTYRVVMIKKQGGLHGSLARETSTFRPGDPEWPYVKFVFRSSLFSLVTLADHLYGLHLLVANVAVSSVRESFAASHPVRRFLTPFLYNTVTVNYNAKANLIQRTTLGPRNFAFTDHAMTVAWALVPGLTKLGGIEQAMVEVDFAAHHKERIAKVPGLDTPFQQAKLAMWAIYHRFTVSYLSAYYPDRAAMLRDEELKAFAVDFSRNINSGLNNLDQHNVIDMALASADSLFKYTAAALARIMFEVSLGHEHLGSVQAYAQDVSFCAFCWPEGEMMATKEAALHQAGLMAATSKKMPMLLRDPKDPEDSWTFLFPEGQGKVAAESAYNTFQAELREYSKQIDANTDGWRAAFEAGTRKAPDWPLWKVNPKYLECSVSL
mmetsp:Transcript_7684/g.19607  ORF Transcript_7684/g.19607 Transcript_7684/m.19607 type:complete len:656 (-) Transcript_7684:364-2331(-)